MPGSFFHVWLKGTKMMPLFFLFLFFFPQIDHRGSQSALHLRGTTGEEQLTTLRRAPANPVSVL